jgi:taurine dioxygenase
MAMLPAVEQTYGPLRVTPLPGAFGAEIAGVDLAADLPTDTVVAIRRAWLDHLVVFFRDQLLSPEQFLRFAHRLGATTEYPFVRGIDGYPEIIAVSKLPHETVNFGGVWHTDSPYLPEPPMATLLLAREVPPAGGDTLWSNLHAAFEALPDDMKRRLAGLTIVNSSSLPEVSCTREERLRDAARDPDHPSPALVAQHPAIRTHPETGRQALYVSPAHAVRFAGRSDDESRPLLEQLIAHCTRLEFICRFHWRPGSLALWDNRCTLHYPENDYHGYRRVMHRISLAR